MTDVRTTTTKFPILNNSADWRMWSTEILAKIIDRSYDAYAILQGELLPPHGYQTSPLPRQASTEPPSEVDAATEELMKAYKRADGIARSYLFQGLAKQHKSVISSALSARAAWILLEERFGTPTAYDVVIMRRKLLSMKQGKASGEDYIASVQAKVQDLTDANIMVDEITICDVIIQGLHAKYEQVVNALQHTLAMTSIKQDNILQDFIKVALSLITQYDAKVNTYTTSSVATDAALPAKEYQRPAKGKPNQNKGVKKVACSVCHRDNHQTANCFYNPSGAQYKGTPWRSNNEGYNQANVSHSEDHAMLANYTERTSNWICDSGATSHITYDKSDFTSFYAKESTVIVGGKHVLQVKGIGTVRLRASIGSTTHNIILQDTLYVPAMGFKLFSLDRLVHNGLHRISINGTGLKAYRTTDSKIVCQGTRVNRTIFLDAKCDVNKALITSKPVPDDMMLWHQRLGHIATEAVKATIMDIKHSPNIHQDGSLCQACLQGGQQRQPFRVREERSTKPLQVLHADLMGPLPLSTWNATYILILVDDATGYCKLQSLKTKQASGILDTLQLFIPQAERTTGNQLKVFRSDGGGEFFSKELDAYFAKQGIVHQCSVPYTPQQNGVAERFNRTVMEMVKAVLIKANAPSRFWSEALLHTEWILNRIKRPGKSSPYLQWHGQPADIEMARTFGCVAHTMINAGHDNTNRRKMDAKSHPLFFAGYSETKKAYRLLDPNNNYKCIEARDVIFDETTTFFKSKHDISRLETPVSDAEEQQEHITIYHEEPLEDSPASSEHGANDAQGPEQPDQDAQGGDQAQADAPYTFRNQARKDYRTISGHAPQTLFPESRSFQTYREPTQETLDAGSPLTSSSEMEAEEELIAQDAVEFRALVTVDAALKDPQSIEEAQQRKDWPRFKEAIEVELKNHATNNTWTLAPLPYGRKAIGAKWVLTIKRNGDGSIAKYKARLVARGFTQREGIDFKETFSPVVRTGTIRLVIAIAALYNWEVHQMDVIAAYLNGHLEEDIYMIQPPGFEQPNNMVCKLNKGLYGLKQSGRVWYHKAHEALTRLGLTRVDADQGLYFLQKQGEQCIICLYVDDIVITASTNKTLHAIKDMLKKEFNMTDGGPISYILGIRVKRSNFSITLDQYSYIDKVLQRFQMESSNTVSTPVNPSFDLMSADKTTPLNNQQIKQYQAGVGSVMYAAMATRPDIAYAAQVLSRRLSNPTEAHASALKHLLRYLKGTQDYQLKYTIGDNNTLQGLHLFCDADYAGDKLSARSTTGVISFFNGGAITWSSRRQDVVAQSTLESEYIALNEGAKEATWLRELLERLGHAQQKATPVYADNLGANSYSKETVYHRRTKHINVKYHYVREQVQAGVINIQYINTSDQKADFLTKGLKRINHERATMDMQKR